MSIKRAFTTLSIAIISVVATLSFSSCTEETVVTDKEIYYMEWESFNGTDDEQAEIESYFQSFFGVESNTFAVSGYGSTFDSDEYVFDTITTAGDYLISLSLYEFTCRLVVYNALTKDLVATFEM